MLSLERIFLLILIYFIGFFTASAQVERKNGYTLKTVVIDPGHGGKDPGAVGSKVTEKEVVLAIALKLGEYIESKMDGVNVVYTRTTDEFVPLYKRAEIANSCKADLFISIHANALSKKDAKGTETLVLGLHRAEENFEIAKKENEVILLEEDYHTRYEGFDPESPESYIMLTLMQTVYFDHSINFASYVQEQFRDRAQRIDRGVKQQGLLVLAQTSMPGVLIETGFVTNSDEQEYLMSDEGQDYVASAIYRAFREYKKFVESRSAPMQTLSSPPDSDMTTQSSSSGTKGSSTVKVAGQTMEIRKTKNDTAGPHELPGDTDSRTDSDIEFKVQVTVSSNPIPLNSEVFKEMTDVEEFDEDGFYKYAVGSRKTYNEIVEYSKWVKNRFQDAFVIAVKNGRIIPLEQAFKESSIKTN